MGIDEEFTEPEISKEGPVIGRDAVAGALAGVDSLRGLDKARYAAAGQFIAYVMFTVQLANGSHPKNAADFAPGDSRGEELARGLLADGVAPLCCDYCAYLMAVALAAAAARQMAVLHGQADANRQWHQLTYALGGTAAAA